MNTSKNLKSFLLVFIIFLTSFWLWFFTRESIDLKENLQNSLNFSQWISQLNVKNSQNIDLSLFWEAYNIITNNFYWKNEIKQDEIIKKIISGLTDSLWDKFSEYMDVETTKQFNNVLSGDFEWIWAVIKKHELWVLVDSMIKWSPALKWGLLKWDIIIKANSISLAWMDTTKAVELIKWPSGSKVNLEILRVWETDILIKEITREKIKIPSVDTTDIKRDDIWYISLNMFWENTASEFLELLNTFKNDEKIKWVIIDLRDNWGGYLQSAVEILSNFIEKWKPLVTTKFTNSALNEVYTSNNTWNIFGKKIIILINWNSASASEITAWALKDYNKAILVWEKSYWKWSVQQPFSLKDGSMIKLTIAKWYTPKDVSIDHNGINPDIEIKLQREDYTPVPGKENEFQFYDRQLEVAKTIMDKYLKLDNASLAIDEYYKENPKPEAKVEENNTWSTNKVD